MAQVLVTAELAASAEEVWRMVGDFAAFGDWHPMVLHSEARGGGRGAVRRCRLIDGGLIEERLEHTSNRERLCLYSIAGTLPIANCVAEIRVRELANGRSRVEWSCQFAPSGAREVDAATALQDLFQAGLDSLKVLYGAGTASAEDGR